MALGLDTLKSLGGGLLSAIQAVLGAIARFFGSLFQAEVNIVDNLHRIVEAFDETKDSIEREVQKIKEFKFDPKWKTRVISVPQAVDQIKDLVDTVVAGFKDKIAEIRAPIHDLSLIFKAEALESQSIADQPSKLAKVGVKIDEIATMIDDLADAMESVKDMAELFEKITEDIQSLDEVFLPQGKTKQLVDVSYRKRTGV